MVNNANTYLPPTPVIPGALIIAAITQTYPMQVTFTDTDENSYIPGQLVRLLIPIKYGMQQANGQTGEILAINSNVFYLDINATLYDPFSVPPDAQFTVKPASLSPAGSRNLTFNNSTARIPFQSLNNIGN